MKRINAKTIAAVYTDSLINDKINKEDSSKS